MAAKGKTSTLDVGRFPTQRAPWRPAEKACIQSQTAAPVKTRVRGCVSFSPSRPGGRETSNQFPHRGLQASDAETRVGLFSWDEENRLVQAKRTSDSVVLGSYKYDALGRRVQKVTAEGTRTYVLSGAQVVQEYVGTVLSQSYVYGTYVDEVLVQVSGAGVKNYFHTNHLYSTAALTNSAGGVVERYGYDAYGKRVTLNPDGTAKSGNAVTTVGFTGRTLDAETGLWYFRARYFSDGLNRFIGRDPKKYVNGYSLYSSYFLPNKMDPHGTVTLDYTPYSAPFPYSLVNYSSGISGPDSAAYTISSWKISCECKVCDNNDKCNSLDCTITNFAHIFIYKDRDVSMDDQWELMGIYGHEVKHITVPREVVEENVVPLVKAYEDKTKCVDPTTCNTAKDLIEKEVQKTLDNIVLLNARADHRGLPGLPGPSERVIDPNWWIAMEVPSPGA